MPLGWNWRHRSRLPAGAALGEKLAEAVQSKVAASAEAGLSPEEIARDLGVFAKSPLVAEAVLEAREQEQETSNPRFAKEKVMPRGSGAKPIAHEAIDLIRQLAGEGKNTTEVQKALEERAQTDARFKVSAPTVWKYWRVRRGEVGLATPFNATLWSKERKAKRAKKLNGTQKASSLGKNLQKISDGLKLEDRRRIIEALVSVYVDAKTGYTKDYTDQKVANELSVPAAWVEAVRALNFGPVKSNEESTEFIGEARKLVDEARQLQKNVAASISDLKFRIDTLEKRAISIQKALS